METPQRPRYEMVDVQPGFVIIEKEMYSHTARAYFSAEAAPPKEPYREGGQVWSFWEMAQSVRFGLRDTSTGEVTRLDEMLGLVFYGSCGPETDLYQIGELAQESRISIYVAVTYESPDGSRLNIATDKIRLLNRFFNERIHSRDKKILILPDLFGLYRELTYGQIMLDFGLVAMDGAAGQQGESA